MYEAATVKSVGVKLMKQNLPAWAGLSLGQGGGCLHQNTLALRALNYIALPHHYHQLASTVHTPFTQKTKYNLIHEDWCKIAWILLARNDWCIIWGVACITLIQPKSFTTILFTIQKFKINITVLRCGVKSALVLLIKSSAILCNLSNKPIRSLILCGDRSKPSRLPLG